MHLAKLLAYFQTSPALRLLRSPNAPFIVDFLHQTFKKAGLITLPFSALHAALRAYREGIQESFPDALRDKAELYLSAWCSAETRWLQRFLEAGRDEPVYQLTPPTEDVLGFLDRVLAQELGFVPTESRLRLVIDSLEDLVVGASDDPATRLSHLRLEKQRIEQEICRIEQEGVAPRYPPPQVRERFGTAVSLLRQLQGDFRAVEERFQEITREVQQRQGEGRESRSGILQHALDAEDVLMRNDQGATFQELVRLILAPAQQEKLQSLAGQLGGIEDLSGQEEGLRAVRQMVPTLLAEAEKVMRTTQRLSATLRRLLEPRSSRQNQRLAQLCGEILGLAASLADDPPRSAVGLDVDLRIPLTSPFARTFWSEPARLDLVPLCEHVLDEDRRSDTFRLLGEMRRLDWRQMRERVKATVAVHGPVTLGGLFAEHPPEAGVLEALAYLQIARDDGHAISREGVEEITVPSSRDPDRALVLTVPLVHFVAR
jgi:hypothetical protein